MLINLMPSGRIELPASGLLDQRSNPWAMKACGMEPD